MKHARNEEDVRNSQYVMSYYYCDGLSSKDSAGILCSVIYHYISVIYAIHV